MCALTRGYGENAAGLFSTLCIVKVFGSGSDDDAQLPEKDSIFNVLIDRKFYSTLNLIIARMFQGRKLLSFPNGG